MMSFPIKGKLYELRADREGIYYFYNHCMVNKSSNTLSISLQDSISNRIFMFLDFCSNDNRFRIRLLHLRTGTIVYYIGYQYDEQMLSLKICSEIFGEEFKKLEQSDL
jgi:hypothetical protein